MPTATAAPVSNCSDSTAEAALPQAAGVPVHSVLARLRRGDIRYEPYPHLVVENCLPADYYRALARSYPSDDLVLQRMGRRHPRQNQRSDISACKALQDPGLAAIWRAFVRYHTSAAFYAELLALLGPEMRAVHPRLEARLGQSLESCRVGLRRGGRLDDGQISLDCQIGINTSVVRRSSVRRVHTDAVEELFAMLLYFRREEDDAEGGDLELYRWKPGCPRRFVGQEVAEQDAEHVATIPYRANTLVIFINSEHSLHAVSERAVTPHSRRLVNIIGEVYRSLPEGLFVKTPRAAPPRGLLAQLLHRWAGA